MYECQQVQQYLVLACREELGTTLGECSFAHQWGRFPAAKVKRQTALQLCVSLADHHDSHQANVVSGGAFGCEEHAVPELCDAFILWANILGAPVTTEFIKCQMGFSRPLFATDHLESSGIEYLFLIYVYFLKMISSFNWTRILSLKNVKLRNGDHR